MLYTAMLCYVMSCHVLLCYDILIMIYYVMLWYPIGGNQSESNPINFFFKKNHFLNEEKTHFLSFFAKLNFPPFLLKCFTACSLATAPLAAVNVFFPCPTPKREQNTLEKRMNREKRLAVGLGKNSLQLPGTCP